MGNRVKESIIIPMNPHGDYSGGSTPGSIIAQQWFAERKGRVIISFDKGCKYINSLEKPHLGFFRDTSTEERLVTHRFSIIDITDDWGINKFLEGAIAPWNKKFLPPWRQDLYEETIAKPRKRRTWMLIGDIYELSKPKRLEYFGKKTSQSFVYSSVGSELRYSREKPNPDEFIDDIISRSARTQVRFTEDDLELIIWALMVKHNAEYITRQRRIEGKNLRLDLLTKTPEGEYVVMELKRDTATKETLVDQLRPYMNGIKKDFRLSKLRGVIVAKNASSDLRRELSKTENEDIKFIPYTFSLKLDLFE